MAPNAKQTVEPRLRIGTVPLEPLKREVPPQPGHMIRLALKVNGRGHEILVHRRMLPHGNPLLKMGFEIQGSGDFHIILDGRDGRKVPDGLPYINYVSALYDGKLKYESRGSFQDKCWQLLKLYGFGVEMDDKLYQDHVMDVLRWEMYEPDQYGNGPRAPSILVCNAIFASTPVLPLLRKWSIYAAIWYGLGQELARADLSTVPDFHKGFSLDLIIQQCSCIRHRQNFEYIYRCIRDAAPWPFFHTIPGSIDQLKPKEMPRWPNWGNVIVGRGIPSQVPPKQKAVSPPEPIVYDGWVPYEHSDRRSSAQPRETQSPASTVQTADMLSPASTVRTADMLSPASTEQTADTLSPMNIAQTAETLSPVSIASPAEVLNQVMKRESEEEEEMQGVEDARPNVMGTVGFPVRE